MEEYVKIVTRDRLYKDEMESLMTKFLFLEIVRGMRLTLKTMFKKPVTRRYPKEKRQAKPGFRGLHALVRNPETGNAKCVGCGLCAAMCPSKCIYIYTREGDNHEKVVERYEIEVLRCVYCSLCVEACPFQAIALTETYDYAAFSKQELFYTKDRLLKNWDDFMTEEKKKRYFESFWGPKTSFFRENESQATFKGKS
ncbi:MAG: NADH-quinone oxidoreductase subunit NuoI [Candidatus Magnetoovum sp. WYHC-5]|nr:NADH-quinone oxidoreductase subunit NuoI [Candidatus Magnetoovum sp. WYHC-5]